jgi:hypothetical protein
MPMKPSNKTKAVASRSGDASETMAASTITPTTVCVSQPLLTNRLADSQTMLIILFISLLLWLSIEAFLDYDAYSSSVLDDTVKIGACFAGTIKMWFRRLNSFLKTTVVSPEVASTVWAVYIWHGREGSLSFAGLFQTLAVTNGSGAGADFVLA